MNTSALCTWGNEVLVSNGSFLEHPPEQVSSTPWSRVIRFSTSMGTYYLKQTPSNPFFSNEPQIIQLLRTQFHAKVPLVIALNEELHCFLMNDAGDPLRATLKTHFRPELLCKAIKHYAAIQRATEHDVATFLKLGLPDWRLKTLPLSYDHLIRQTAFLRAEGFTDKALQRMHDLSPHFSAQCTQLESFGIPETIGYHDFHDNNVLLDPKTKELTCADWSEAAIIHPFFSLHTCLEQAITHHRIKEGDALHQKLQDACLEPWLELADKEHLLEAFILAKKVRLIWNILACNEFILGVDPKAYKAYYPDRPHPMTENFRKYLDEAD